jgi:branched-chain amino acid transport system permease protein
MEIVLAQTIVNGVMVGMIYMLMAIGFTMVFGIMRIVNFAHGEFYMVGAFLFAILYGT